MTWHGPQSCSVHEKRWRSARPFLLLGLLSWPLWATDLPIAPYAIDTWTTADGLPQNSITAMAQTPDGYLWLGTFRGLVRFDGQRFEVFDQDNAPGLGGLAVSGLYADQRGRLWMRDSSTAAITRMEQGRFYSNFLARVYYAFREDRRGALWAISFRGDGSWFRWDHDRFTPMPLPPGCPTNGPVGIGFDQQGDLWIVTTNQLGPLVDGQFRPLVTSDFYAEEDGKFRVLDNARFWYHAHRHGGYWLKRRDGMEHLRPDGTIGECIQFPARIKSALASMVEDSRGRIWLLNDDGELWIRDSHGAWSKLTPAQGLFPRVRATFEDREGTMWVGTDGGGLQRLRPLLFKSCDEQHGLRELSMHGVTEDTEANLWVAMYREGLKRLEGDRFVRVYPTDPDARASADTVLASTRGGVWSTWGGSKLLHFAGTNVSGDLLQQAPSNLVRTARALFEDRRGRLWIGLIQGAACVDNGAFAFYPSPEGDWRNQQVRCIAEGPPETMWFGTSGSGLLRLCHGELTAFTIGDGLPANAVNSLVADPDGTLWIGTPKGLSRYRDGKFLTCSMKDGLPDKVIQCVLDDGLGWLWMSSYRGIIRVARSEFENFFAGKSSRVWCDLYGERDGLKTRESQSGRQPMAWKGRDGRLWFLNLKGVAVIDPKSIPRNSVPPRIVIQEVRVDGKVGPAVPGEPSPQEQQAAATANVIVPPKEIVIPPGTHRLEITYAALSYVQPERNRYRYRLHGFDKDWVDAANERVAEYTSVPPGTYRFEVMGTNNDGVRSETAASLALVFRPHYWQTTWFQALAILFGIGTVGAGLRQLELRNIRRKMAQLERQLAVDRERERIAQDMHDDLGANLTRIKLLGELVERELDAPDQAAAHAQHISRTARELAQSMDEIVWTVNPQKDQLENFVLYLSSYTEELLGATSVRCRLDFPETVPDIPLASEIRHHLFLAVKEALNNALKHAGANEVRLRLALRDHELAVLVEDDGRGFDPGTASPDANGLANMESRLSRIGGACSIESQPGAGTKVRMSVQLP